MPACNLQLGSLCDSQPRPKTCLEPRREAMQHSQARSSRCLCRSTISAPTPARGKEKQGPRSEACHVSL